MSDLPLAWILPAAFFVGSCVGSFLNVVIHRVPRGQSVISPPSSCPGCGHRIRAWQNVPVLSWILLRGRCAGCAAPISWRYPLVELLGGFLGLACVAQFGLSWLALSSFSLLGAMLAVAFIDWEFMIIPDPISLGFLVLGLVLSPWTGPGLLQGILGAVVAGGLLLLIGVVWEKTRGIEAMGGGDVKLMAAVGAFLGVVQALMVIFFAAFLGAVVGALLLRRTGQSRIAFGTFLAAATVVVVFVGQDLLDWYLSFLRPQA